MRIGIIGGGASGTFAAIRIKELNPSFDVTIIERNDKLMKKVAVTGNGRCNYANLGSLENKYNNKFANPGNLDTWENVGKQVKTYYTLHCPEKVTTDTLSLWNMIKGALDPAHKSEG